MTTFLSVTQSLYFTQSLPSAKNSHFPLTFCTHGSFQGFQLVVSELTCLEYYQGDVNQVCKIDPDLCKT